MPTNDVVFIRGAVFTGSGAPLQNHAVAISAGRISAVVPDSEADVLIGESTRVVDLDGALLAPGFQDAHIHPVGGGVELLQCNLTEATDAAAAVAAVQAYAVANPEEPWILGGGWSMDHFPGGAPLRGLLDAVVPDRPVLIQSRDHHSAWANTAAIQAAGIDAATPDPSDGRIEREADGTPAGTFHEGAMELFSGVRPELSDDFAYQGLLRAQGELVALGITAWQDAMVGTVSGVADPLGAYRRALDEGTLLVKVVGAQWWERSGGIEQVERFTARRDEFAARGADRLRLGTVKIMVDGVAENQTAAMLTPYRDHHGHDTHNSGMSFVDPAAAPRVRDGAGCRRPAGALPRARRPRRARGARRAWPPRVPRTVQPTGGITSRTCRSSTRPMSRASPTSTRSRTSRRSGRPTRTSSTT